MVADIAPPQFYQSVLADFIREGHFSRHLRRTRTIYRELRSVLSESIREEFGFGADVTGSEAGLHLTVSLKGIRDHEIASKAARQNLWLVPLSSSYQENPTRQGFILGFGSIETKEIRPAVRKLLGLTRS
jgi:GntR family transcriptional regulator/MocR family aminotransferase